MDLAYINDVVRCAVGVAVYVLVGVALTPAWQRFDRFMDDDKVSNINQKARGLMAVLWPLLIPIGAIATVRWIVLSAGLLSEWMFPDDGEG